MKVLTSEIIKMRKKSHNQWNITQILSYQAAAHMATDLWQRSFCFCRNNAVAGIVVHFKAEKLQSLSLFSSWCKKTVKKKKKKLYPSSWELFFGGLIFPHSSPWGCWLSAAGCLDYILVLWSALSGQAAHTQASFSSGCVHKRLSVHKQRPKFCP